MFRDEDEIEAEIRLDAHNDALTDERRDKIEDDTVTVNGREYPPMDVIEGRCRADLMKTGYDGVTYLQSAMYGALRAYYMFMQADISELQREVERLNKFIAGMTDVLRGEAELSKTF